MVVPPHLLPSIGNPFAARNGGTEFMLLYLSCLEKAKQANLIFLFFLPHSSSAPATALLGKSKTSASVAVAIIIASAVKESLDGWGGLTRR